MKHLSQMVEAKTLAALAAATAIAGSTLFVGGALAAGGGQAGPGGIARDRTGGYYDPARSTYIPAQTAGVSRRHTVVSTRFRVLWPQAGSIVKDASGGYYDPARSTYVPAPASA